MVGSGMHQEGGKKKKDVHVPSLKSTLGKKENWPIERSGEWRERGIL